MTEHWTNENSTIWMSHEEYLKMQELKHEFWYGKREPRVPQEEDFVKLAIVDDNKMIGVHNKTMQGYELRDDVPAVKLPLVPTTYTTFNRWATGFDV